MDFVGVVVAGCAPGEPDCAAGTVPNGPDAWFVVLVLLLLVAVVGGAAVFLRRRMARRGEAAPVAQETTARA
jgi:hypothetical protein